MSENMKYRISYGFSILMIIAMAVFLIWLMVAPIIFHKKFSEEREITQTIKDENTSDRKIRFCEEQIAGELKQFPVFDRSSVTIAKPKDEYHPVIITGSFNNSFDGDGKEVKTYICNVKTSDSGYFATVEIFDEDEIT